MNKQEELNTMVLQAMIKTQALIREASADWLEQEPLEANAPKPYEGDREEPVIEER